MAFGSIEEHTAKIHIKGLKLSQLSEEAFIRVHIFSPIFNKLQSLL